MPQFAAASSALDPSVPLLSSVNNYSSVVDLAMNEESNDAVDSALAHVTSELDSAVSDHMADDIREFYVSLFVPQVPDAYVNATRVDARDDVEACARA